MTETTFFAAETGTRTVDFRRRSRRAGSNNAGPGCGTPFFRQCPRTAFSRPKRSGGSGTFDGKTEDQPANSVDSGRCGAGSIQVGCDPARDSGIACQAVFDIDADICEIMDLMISVETGSSF